MYAIFQLLIVFAEVIVACSSLLLNITLVWCVRNLTFCLRLSGWFPHFSLCFFRSELVVHQLRVKRTRCNWLIIFCNCQVNGLGKFGKKKRSILMYHRLFSVVHWLLLLSRVVQPGKLFLEIPPHFFVFLFYTNVSSIYATLGSHPKLVCRPSNCFHAISNIS